MEKIRVVLFGVGVVSGMIAKSLLEKAGVEIVGAIDVATDKVNRNLGEVLGTGQKLGVTVLEDVDAVFSRTKPHIAVHATSSSFKDTYPQIASIVKHGVNVISTCEELAYPYLLHSDLAEKLDRLAKQHDVTVLGTGINPGFLMDTLVIMLTAPCQRVSKITVERVMNAATRRVPFQKKIGVGLTVQEFRRRIQEKQISGHVGLKQSIAMVAAALAWKLDRITVEQVEPVSAKHIARSGDIEIKAGNVAGLRQKAKGLMENREVIVLDFQAYVGAEEEHDSVTIEGIPYISQKIRPCVHGDVGTVAMVVNSIPKVINAPAGLLTMKDLPIPSAVLGDMRDHVVGM